MKYNHWSELTRIDADELLRELQSLHARIRALDGPPYLMVVAAAELQVHIDMIDKELHQRANELPGLKKPMEEA